MDGCEKEGRKISREGRSLVEIRDDSDGMVMETPRVPLIMP